MPVKNALQSTLAGGGQDGFIDKYNPDYKLEYATYLGGASGTDNIFSMAIGPDDSLYMTGENMSPDMATGNAWLRQPLAYSSYVAKINPAGTAMAYFTYIGHRSGYTKAQAVTVDSAGRAYVVGYTSAKQMPTTSDALQPKYAGGFRDAFLLRLDADGSAAEYLTYLGGSYNGQSDPDETASAVRSMTTGTSTLQGKPAQPTFPGVARCRALMAECTMPTSCASTLRTIRLSTQRSGEARRKMPLSRWRSARETRRRW